MTKTVTLRYPDGKYTTVPYRDGRRSAETNLLIVELCRKAKRGKSADCMIYHEIMDKNKELESALGHPVLYCFVIKSSLYIVSKLAPGGMGVAMCIKYDHNQGQMLQDFDDYTKRTFLKKYSGKSTVLRLRPPRVRNVEHVEAAPGRPREGSSHTGGPRYLQSRGALKRMEDAGLIPRRLAA
jgi:hypothetical protein